VSARIAGQVAKVYVDENQVVKAGDTIAELDPADYQVAVENAEAALASAQATPRAANVNVPITTVNTGSNLRSAGADVSGLRRALGRQRSNWIQRTLGVTEAQATLRRRRPILERYKPLVERLHQQAAVDAACRSRLDQRLVALQIGLRLRKVGLGLGHASVR